MDNEELFCSWDINPILDLSKYLDKEIRVKFQGGREAQGILKGWVRFYVQVPD